MSTMEIDVGSLTVPRTGVTMWTLTLPPGVRATGPLAGRMRQYWERGWRQSGRTPPPGLLILESGYSLASLTGDQLRDAGFCRIKGDHPCQDETTPQSSARG
jgi:hypothetical protein